MSNIVKSAMVSGVALCSALFASQVLAAPHLIRCGGVPQPLTFSDPVYSGIGCPSGSVQFLGSPDVENQFSLLFSKLSAQINYPGFPNAIRSSCNVRMAVGVPPGFQMNFGKVRFRGFADIPFLGRGTQEAIIEFPLLGGSERTLVRTRIDGPYQDLYERTEPVSLPTFSRCGGTSTLTIDSNVFVGGNFSPRTQITLDSIDGAVLYQYGFSCRPCR